MESNNAAKSYSSSGSTGQNGSGGSGGTGGYRGNNKEGTWCEWQGGWGCSGWGISGSDRTIGSSDRACHGSEGGINYSRSSPKETATAFQNNVGTAKIDFINKLLELKESTDFFTKIQIPYLKDFSEKNSIQLSGHGTGDLVESFGYHEHFNKYYNDGIDTILNLRIKDLGIENVKALKAEFYMTADSTQAKIIVNKIVNTGMTSEIKILVPYNIENKHWVGFVFEPKQGNQIEVTYLDPENNEIPESLAAELSARLQEQGYNVSLRQINVPTQKSNNCGPEMIEDFVLHLTNSRVNEEEAVGYHTVLVEDMLLGNSTFSDLI